MDNLIYYKDGECYINKQTKYFKSIDGYNNCYVNSNTNTIHETEVCHFIINNNGINNSYRYTIDEYHNKYCYFDEHLNVWIINPPEN